MSAYIMLAANSSANNSHRKQVVKRKAKKESTSTRSSSTRSDSGGSHDAASTSANSIRRHNTLTSSHSSGSGSLNDKKSPNPRKKVYDINSNSYVDPIFLMTPAEKKVTQFTSRYETITQGSKFQHMNDKLNSRYLEAGPDGGLLFTIKNLDLLRYTYFKQFNHDYELIARKLSKRKSSNNSSRLKFVRKIDKLKQKNDTFYFSGSTNPPSPELSNSESEDDDDSVHNITEKMSNLEKSSQPSIRSLIRDNHFWNNVYQDIKFNYIQLKLSLNYFDLLPRVNDSIQFFTELFDFFLYNIQVLGIDPNENQAENGKLKSADIEILKSYKFFYFSDESYETLNQMSKKHHGLYQAQATMNISLNSPIHSNFNIDKRESTQQELSLHRDLMTKMIETLIENMKSSLNISNRKFQHAADESLFTLWESFLRFIIFDILVNEKNFHDESKPSCTTTKPESKTDYRAKPSSLSISPPSFSYFGDDLATPTSPQFDQSSTRQSMLHSPATPSTNNFLSHARPASVNRDKLRMMRNSVASSVSITSRSTAPSSIMSSPRQYMHKPSISTYSSSGYADHDFATPTPITEEEITKFNESMSALDTDDKPQNQEDVESIRPVVKEDHEQQPTKAETKKSLSHRMSRTSLASVKTNKSRMSIFGKFRK